MINACIFGPAILKDFQLHCFAAPMVCIQTFLNGTVGMCLPTCKSWIKVYSDDVGMSAISSFIMNPGTLSQRSLEASTLSPKYHQALRQLHIKMVNGILYYHVLIVGSAPYACRQLIHAAFWNIVFIAFHSNPLGGRLNAVRTFHQIRLRFYWPNMYSYISCMCHSCPGCALTNLTRAKSSKLIYNFPNEAPFLVLHINGYQAGKELGFEGSSHYLIACCGMCIIAVVELVANANMTTYASTIINIILLLCFCHTCILNKDNKFFWVCHEALNLLQINC
jgi:hypothetical protein